MVYRITDIILILLTTIQSFGQLNTICDKVIEIDTLEYRRNFVTDDPIQPTKQYNKIKDKLVIKTKSITYSFTDRFDHGDFVTKYRILGEDHKRNWVWIEQQNLHATLTYLINTKTSQIDTLVGPIKMYKDKIISLEDGYTDSPRQIQIYEIINDRIVELNKFKLEPCDKLCCVRTIYLHGRDIFLADNSGRELRTWKARVL